VVDERSGRAGDARRHSTGRCFGDNGKLVTTPRINQQIATPEKESDGDPGKDPRRLFRMISRLFLGFGVLWGWVACSSC